MAITFVSTNSTNGATSLSLTCSGNRPFLFVHTSTPQSSITYNGISLTKAVANGWSEVWYLFNPPTGTSYNINFSDSTRAEAGCFSNVSESAGIINTGVGSGNGTNAAVVTITSLLGTDCLIAGCGGNYGYASLYLGTGFGNGSGFSNSAYNIAGDTTAACGWNDDDNKTAAGLVVRNDDSIPSTAVSSLLTPMWFT